MVVISGNELTKKYNDKFKQDTIALINCNIEIEHGTFVVITGKVGSGKSTLLRLLAGYEQPSSGSLVLKSSKGKFYKHIEGNTQNYKEIGTILKEDGLLPILTVYENIIMPGALQGIKYDKEYLDFLLKTFHLTEQIHQYPKHLSLEMRHCVSVIRALINQPSIMLVDDSAEIISIPLAYQILELLLQYHHKSNCTLVFATRKSELDIFANHAIYMEKGRIIRDVKKQLKIVNYV